MADSTASRSVRSLSRGFTPNRSSVLLISASVLPNRWRDETMVRPCALTASSALLIAAIPELNAVTWAAPVSAFTRCSKLVTVGFSMRA